VQKKSIKKIINEYLQLEEKDAESVFNQLFLYICSIEARTSSEDLYILAKLLKANDIKKIIDFYDGDTLKIPRKEDYRISMLVALCFFLKEIKGYSWSDIKDFIDLSDNNTDILSTISIGRKINNIKAKLGKDILRALQNLHIENLQTLFGYFGEVQGYIYDENERSKEIEEGAE
jgi:hypothetical protein